MGKENTFFGDFHFAVLWRHLFSKKKWNWIHDNSSSSWKGENTHPEAALLFKQNRIKTWGEAETRQSSSQVFLSMMVFSCRDPFLYNSPCLGKANHHDGQRKWELFVMTSYVQTYRHLCHRRAAWKTTGIHIQQEMVPGIIPVLSLLSTHNKRGAEIPFFPMY